MYTPKNILFTGGLGFIGSNVLNHLVKKYPEATFINFDADYYCGTENNILVSRLKNYHFVRGNLNSNDLVSYVLKKFNIDTVMHFAAQSHVDNSFNNSIEFTKDNIFATHNLLEMCKRYGKIKRFIHVSTDEVYGESNFEDDSSCKKQENSLLCPTNPYAATKAAAEMLVNAYYKSFNIPVIITRGNNVYGTRQYPEKIIPRFITLLDNDIPCTIHGEGNNTRSFVHVEDVANAFDLILHKGIVGEIYNIGSSEELSIKDIASRLITIMKPNDPINTWMIHVPDREFNDDRYFICDNKLKELGWTPKYSIGSSLKDIILWYTKEIDIFSHFNCKKEEILK